MRLFFETLKQRNEILFYFGWICLVLAIGCIVISRVSTTQVLGVNAWYKPFKFFLSTSIFVWSMAWLLYYVPPSRMITAYAWGMVALFTFENVYIVFQAWRGQMSHFNVSTPILSSLWSLMAFAALSISIWTLVVSVPFFGTSLSHLEDYYIWSIRLAMIGFVIFSIEGMAMGARMAHTVGGADGSAGLPVLNWSRTLGDLRVAHFLGMHALQVIPLVSFYLIRNVKGTIVFGVIYLAFVAFSLVQALRGRPLIG
jgi:hypothetical protein